MGCGMGKSDIYKDEKILSYKRQFDALQLTAHDVNKLYWIYRQIDNDNGGTIGLPELLAFIDIEKTQFSESVFSIFDKDGSGELDFREFTLSIWNYCTLNQLSLEYFAYNLYDRDLSGLLSIDEMHNMLRDIYGVNFKTNKYAKSISDELFNKKQNKSGSVTIDEFIVFCRNHQALLFPAFEMQQALMRATLGVKFWTKLSATRAKLSDNEFMPVDKFIQKFLEVGNSKNVLHRMAESISSKSNKVFTAATTSSHDKHVKKAYMNTDRVKPQPKKRDAHCEHPVHGKQGHHAPDQPYGARGSHDQLHMLDLKPITLDQMAHNSHTHQKKDYTEAHKDLKQAIMDRLYDQTVDPIAATRSRIGHSPHITPQVSPRHHDKHITAKPQPSTAIPSIVDRQHHSNPNEHITPQFQAGDVSVGNDIKFLDHHGIPLVPKKDTTAVHTTDKLGSNHGHGHGHNASRDGRRQSRGHANH